MLAKSMRVHTKRRTYSTVWRRCASRSMLPLSILQISCWCLCAFDPAPLLPCATLCSVSRPPARSIPRPPNPSLMSSALYHASGPVLLILISTTPTTSQATQCSYPAWIVKRRPVNAIHALNLDLERVEYQPSPIFEGQRDRHTILPIPHAAVDKHA